MSNKYIYDMKKHKYMLKIKPLYIYIYILAAL